MAKHLSINQRLDKAKQPEVRREIVEDWSRNWQADQLQALALVRTGLESQDFGKVRHGLEQLEGITAKRFTAMPGVIEKLTGAE